MNNILDRGSLVALERKAQQEQGLSSELMIENAGFVVYEYITKIITRDDQVAIFVGKGNNGQDGLAVARLLHLRGYKPTVYLVERFECSRLTDLGVLGVPMFVVSDAAELALARFGLIVDAIFGIGLDRAIEGNTANIISAINRARAHTVSIDIPSGLDCDGAGVRGVAVIADCTITFSAVKVGMLVDEAIDYVGDVVVADIGLRCDSDSVVKLITDIDIALPARKRRSHKSNYGKIKIIGGSSTMPGAAVLCCSAARAAMRGGAGLCTLAVPRSMKVEFGARVTESTLFFLDDHDGEIAFNPDQLDQLASTADSIAIGMGMVEGEALDAILDYLVSHFEGKLIIDATALRVLAKNLQILKNAKAQIVLTPHKGELDGLLDAFDGGLPDSDIFRMRAFASAFGVIIVAKGAHTFITDGKATFVTTTGSAGMAKGGSGDVLAGILTALSARDIPLIKAAYIATYTFGKAGELGTALFGENGLLASDIARVFSID